MKSLFYFTFGIIIALYAFMVCFNLYAPVYLDDYYLDVLHTNYAKEWYYTNVGISSIAILWTAIWIFNLGKGTNHEKKEPLLTNKEKNE